MHAPRLHYVHPTCFEAGKPMEFVACGSNLLQPKLRYAFLFVFLPIRYHRVVFFLCLLLVACCMLRQSVNVFEYLVEIILINELAVTFHCS